MVDIASIVIAVLACVGAIGAAALAGWVTIFSDERKRLSEAEKLVLKYRDPLLLAAQDLQSRLYNITDQGVTNYARYPGEERDNLLMYTSFLVGQYLSWTYILRREAQFLRFAIDKDNKELSTILSQIRHAFLTDATGPQGAPFMLWQGHQQAVGERMTVLERDQHFCMGYATFHAKWAEDGEFRRWFHPLVDGVTKIAEAGNAGEALVPDQRLRRLQHLLVDLILFLDPKGVRSEAKWTSRCRRAHTCDCSHCKSTRQYELSHVCGIQLMV